MNEIIRHIIVIIGHKMSYISRQAANITNSTQKEEDSTERLAIRSLLGFLEGHGVSLDRDQSVTDRPDFCITICGNRVACECTAIGLQQLFKFHKFAAPWGLQNSIAYPREPFRWAQLAIERKELKRDDYLIKTAAEKCWLIIHDNDPILTISNPGDIEHLKQAAKFTKHGFDQVWFVSRWKELEVLKIFDQTQDSFEHKTIQPIDGVAWPISCRMAMQAKVIDLNDPNAMSTPEDIKIDWRNLETLYEGFYLEYSSNGTEATIRKYGGS